MVSTYWSLGLYVAQELNAEFHSDKDKKIAYLQKIIRLVELMTGGTIEAKPQKIVAGLEPEVYIP
jgi:TRAF3-interacting protein 1